MMLVDKIQSKLKTLRQAEQEDRSQDQARALELPYLDLSGLTIDWEDVKILALDDARKNQTAIIRRFGENVDLGTLDPQKAQNIKKFLEARNFKTRIYVISPKSFSKILATYESIPKEIKKEEIKITAIKNLAELKEKSQSPSATESLGAILGGAKIMQASDVHIEPREDKAKIRYRLDGVLQDILEIQKDQYRKIISRLKILSGLKLNQEEIPQNGRLLIVDGRKKIDIRLSLLPGPQGEAIALRLLDPERISLGLADLGLNEKYLKLIRHELKKTNGMVLVVGPTGSGKTTTIYACLKEINHPEIKVITLEDPIEYRLEGIVQTQIKEDYSFTLGLKNILRQDPDVILVGEIRDREAAEAALNAALTGHLVFSTLHTNDAQGAIPRLIDLGIKPEIIGSAINLIVAQRLIRKQDEKSFTGYKDRTGIFELIKVNGSINNLEIIGSMRQDGLEKIKAGISTREEVDRVTNAQ